MSLRACHQYDFTRGFIKLGLLVTELFVVAARKYKVTRGCLFELKALASFRQNELRLTWSKKVQLFLAEVKDSSVVHKGVCAYKSW